MKYSPKVRAIVLGRNTTPTTYNVARTHYTWTIYAWESDGSENGDPVANQRSDTVGDIRSKMQFR
jgi:hypothetical protein